LSTIFIFFFILFEKVISELDEESQQQVSRKNEKMKYQESLEKDKVHFSQLISDNNSRTIDDQDVKKYLQTALSPYFYNDVIDIIFDYYYTLIKDTFDICNDDLTEHFCGRESSGDNKFPLKITKLDDKQTDKFQLSLGRIGPLGRKRIKILLPSTLGPTIKLSTDDELSLTASSVDASARVRVQFSNLLPKQILLYGWHGQNSCVYGDQVDQKQFILLMQNLSFLVRLFDLRVNHFNDQPGQPFLRNIGQSNIKRDTESDFYYVSEFNGCGHKNTFDINVDDVNNTNITSSTDDDDKKTLDKILTLEYFQLGQNGEIDFFVSLE
jgi:hypothetical protein